TEEVWQIITRGRAGESVVIAPWPQPRGWRNREAEDAMAIVMDVVRSIRNARAEKGVTPGRRIEAVVHAEGDRRAMLEANREVLEALAGLGTLTFDEPGAERPEPAVSLVAAGGVRVFLPLAGMVDLEQERARLLKRREELERERDAAARKLANESFVSKAPAAVVERERERLRAAEEQLEALRAQLAELGG